MKLAWVALALAGCSSVGTIRDGHQTNVARTITAAEWSSFADRMLVSLQQSDVLQRYRGPAGEPVPLMIGDFFNDTDRAEFGVTKDFMYNQLRASLVNAGQVGVLSDAGGTGAQIDRSVANAMELVQSSAYDASTLPEPGKFVGPKLTLSGQFISQSFREGRTTQYDYACALKLIDNRTAETVWEEQVVFPKQFTKGIIGE